MFCVERGEKAALAGLPLGASFPYDDPPITDGDAP
jgi:hypothetical protein